MEEKKYERSRVTISTEEYRDLITKATKCECECDHYRSKYWEAQNKVIQLTDELNKLEENYSLLLENLD